MVGPYAVTIQSLPNEILIYVFSFHRLLSGTNNCPPAVAWRWHTLAHVCQRWRHLIFTSLRHLDARLVVPRKFPNTPLDSWPALPLSVWYDSPNGHISAKQEADIEDAFKQHSYRIHEMHLPATIGYEIWMSLCNVSFPNLEHLAIPGSSEHVITLPRRFLGGSAPLPRRLRSIFLSYLNFPALPQLLFSSRDLVSLHLGHYTLTNLEFTSPTVLSTSLSATTQLEYLYIDCFPIITHLELMNENSSPLNLVVLPALTYFHLGGFIEYMESLVSRIDAPHLEKLDISSDRRLLDILQLSQFISRTELLSSSPFRTSISVDRGNFSIEHHFKHPKSPQEASHVYFKCVDWGGWQVSQVDHICARLSPLASGVKQLKLSAFHLPRDLERKTDPAPWLQLLSPYNSVEEIEFCGKGAPCTGIACALKQSIRETAHDLLPALRILRIRGFHTWSIRLTMSFVAARERTGRPVIVRRLTQKSSDTDWETFENDTCQD